MANKYTIPLAAKQLHLSEAWIRAAIRNGEIESKMEPTHKGSLVMKHVISEKELRRFANREERRAPRREDGRSKWFFYASPEEVNLVKELLYTSNLEQLKVVAQTIQPSTLKGAYLNDHVKVSTSE